MKKPLKYMIVMVILLIVIMGTAGCGSSKSAGGDNASKNENKPTIVIGSKTFTEALLLGTMSYQYLQYLGYPVENKVGLGELAVIRPALESKQIGAYWEYTGTVLINVMKHAPSFDEKESFNLVKEWDAKNNIIWLDNAPLNDTYAVMVRKDIADKYSLRTTSDLIEQIKKGEKIRFITSQEYLGRPDGLTHFETVYNFKYPRDLTILAALNIGYEALKTNQAEMALSYTTDARVKAYGLVTLEDDKKAFAVYSAAPLFRKEILDAYPQIPEQMKKLSSLLDNNTIMDLNKAVDIDKKSVEEVAKEFLTQKGLIK
ncbi:glycine betaine ABC transporter substrate-binding protein [Sporomusa sp.]|uniref:ABC transporter substrate-binding protein n=1 Tax=Sporomusa sp. TaxID=2078658 RepID=UPI002BF846D9|nr:glycine betaine ABC transporter substrate-binding protein [Sporomusa sp.]HWR44956.1 glycine betaine ABC transporter substrate-binding protein [Sporomusa sp.]